MAEMTIGITGGIGSGKSVVARVLRCNGFPVFDCDTEAKILMHRDVGLVESLKKGLGEEIYHPDGTLNRDLLSGKLFSDKEVRSFVNKIVHHAVREEIKSRRRKVKGRFFIESAILATGGIAGMCDSIWVITAPRDEKLLRIGKRDGLRVNEIESRMKAQEKELEMLPETGVVVIENDNRHAILPEILKLTDKYINNQTYTLTC